MIKVIACSLAAIIGVFSKPLLAEDGAYQIELIVFLQTTSNTETLNQAAKPNQQPPDLTELSAYRKPDHTTLDDSYAALSKDATYRPLVHVAWVQPVGESDFSVPVHIRSADGKLDGYLQVQRGQSVQMIVDLGLSVDQDGGSGKSIIYRLNEKRLIKLNEVYYLDHPKFGVVAKISVL